ncbi:MAG: GNAT family N-acetyltransferase [Sphingobacteriales bacterium]|nr:GNAT family N-acetyltransferase [Sphingobacteriales bacterium]
MIKLLEERENEIVAEFAEICTDYALLMEGQLPTEAGSQGFFTDFPEDSNPEQYLAFGIFEANELIGIIRAVKHYPCKNTMHLPLLLLHPEKRSKGKGKSIYQWFESYTLSKGFERICIAVMKENEKAIAFWKSCGFEMGAALPPKALGKQLHDRLEMKKNFAQVAKPC